MKVLIFLLESSHHNFFCLIFINEILVQWQRVRFLSQGSLVRDRLKPHFLFLSFTNSDFLYLSWMSSVLKTETSQKNILMSILRKCKQIRWSIFLSSLNTQKCVCLLQKFCFNLSLLSWMSSKFKNLLEFYCTHRNSIRGQNKTSGALIQRLEQNLSTV